MHPTIRRLIDLHRLTPLPVEGTLFAQTYRSAQELAPGLPAATAMIGLYCEDPPSRSRFHRLTRDELWHFHAGDPLRLILLRPDGWQAGHLEPGGRRDLIPRRDARKFAADAGAPGKARTSGNWPSSSRPRGRGPSGR